MKPTRRLFALTTLACAALAATGTALAQFPDKPLRIVVGAPAGGTADIIARTLSEGLAQQLGQPVMVDNKPGGAGLIGLQEVLKAPRDGHTVLVSVNGIVSEIPHAMKLPVDPMKELRPVAEIARTGLLFVAGPNVPASNLKEAIAYVKANPGKVNYGSYSPGTLSHTLGLELNKLAGTDMVHVGYKGSPPALTDLIGGHVSFMFDGPATSIPMIKGGKIKVFATTAPAHTSEPTRYHRACGDCHKTSAWQPALEGPHAGRFPRGGDHSGVACLECHDPDRGPSADGANTICALCHTSAHHRDPAVPNSCLECHRDGGD